jgi:hypothetical protein
VARGGAGCRCVSDSQQDGRMTSPYAEKALSERAAGTKGAWTQLRSGNLSAGECSLSAKVTKFTLGRFYCHSTDSYRNRTPPRGGVSGGRTWRLPTDRLRTERVTIGETHKKKPESEDRTPPPRTEWEQQPCKKCGSRSVRSEPQQPAIHPAGGGRLRREPFLTPLPAALAAAPSPRDRHANF